MAAQPTSLLLPQMHGGNNKPPTKMYMATHLEHLHRLPMLGGKTKISTEATTAIHQLRPGGRKEGTNHEKDITFCSNGGFEPW